MSSELHRATFFADIKFESEAEFKEDLGPARLYARSKLADILLIKRLVQLYLQPSSKVVAFCTHPGAVSTGQVDQYKDAYGENVGTAIKAVITKGMRAPDDGALSALWAATASDARDKFESGTYFSNPDQDGKETNEAKDQRVSSRHFPAREIFPPFFCHG